MLHYAELVLLVAGGRSVQVPLSRVYDQPVAGLCRLHAAAYTHLHGVSGCTRPACSIHAYTCGAFDLDYDAAAHTQRLSMERNVEALVADEMEAEVLHVDELSGLACVHIGLLAVPVVIVLAFAFGGALTTRPAVARTADAFDIVARRHFVIADLTS